MGEHFDKNSVRQHHLAKVEEILSQGGGPEEIVNYLMSRIGTVISYERRKYERRIAAQWSNHDANRYTRGRATQLR